MSPDPRAEAERLLNECAHEMGRCGYTNPETVVRVADALAARDAHIRTVQDDWYADGERLRAKLADSEMVKEERIAMLLRDVATRDAKIAEVERERDELARLHAAELQAGTLQYAALLAARQRAEQAEANADFLRRSIGECHVMISRKTAEYQCESTWEATTLPARLSRLIRNAETLAELLRRAREWETP